MGTSHSGKAATMDSEGQYLLQLAVVAIERKELVQATEFIHQAIAIDPNNGRYWRSLGELLLMRQSPTEALAAFEQALAILPSSAEINYSMAETLIQLGRIAEASQHFGQSVVLAPEWPEAWFNHGVLLLQLERPEAAWVAFKKAVDLCPEWTAAWSNLGGASDHLGLDDQAIVCWQQVLAIEPENIPALINMGIAQFRKETFDAAIASLERALCRDPGSAKAHLYLGLCHLRRGQVEDAITNYRQALDLRPDYTEAWRNLIDALHLLGRWDEIIDCYNRVIVINPSDPVVYFNMAVALRRKGRIGEALMHCGKARAIDPDFPNATAYLLQLAQHACDWTLAEQLSPVLDQLSAHQIHEGQKPAESPMLSLRRNADPEKNLIIAKAWSKSIDENIRLRPDGPQFKHLCRAERQTIRIGYISNDFKEHAVAHHLLGLLRNHQRNRFRIYLYVCNPEDGSDYRRKLSKSCDHFVEIDRLSDRAAAQRIFDDRIDILVDLMGHTGGGRLEILAMRPAPVQIGYLGFLGSSGAAFIDYFITDAIVTPANPGELLYRKTNLPAGLLSSKRRSNADCRAGGTHCLWFEPRSVGFMLLQPNI
jgi:protein O-GlcNAc transferase